MGTKAMGRHDVLIIIYLDIILLHVPQAFTAPALVTMVDEVVFLPVVPVIRDHIIINGVGMLVALVVIALRFTARFQQMSIGVDDYLVAFSFVKLPTTSYGQ